MRVRLDRVHKRFGETEAVRELSMCIEDGEFLILLGPSGCGKTTTLRMIAGLEHPDSGSIHIGDEDVTNLPPKDRNLAMVFQNYALYPHMTVYENLTFDLKVRGVPVAEIKRRAADVSENLEITQLLDRKPSQLSGGEQQRVALGRAIVREPNVFLMDEPLSNLDAKLRIHMRGELKKLHRQLKRTTVYVTHDQEEAMTVGERIAVLRNGRLQQHATPREIYEKPANQFVAYFVGSPSMNFFDGVIKSDECGLKFLSADFSYSIPGHLCQALDRLPPVENVTLGIRPEHICVARQVATSPAMQGIVDVLEPIGRELHVELILGETSIVAITPPSLDLHVGERVSLQFDGQWCHLFHRESSVNLLAPSADLSSA